MHRFSAETAQALRALIAVDPIRLRVRGDCMAPLLASGADIHVTSRRWYWPGDLVLVHARDGRLLVHRLLGCYPRSGGLRWLSQADAGPHPDAALHRRRILGKVSGGEIHNLAARVPLRHRLWAWGRLLRHALRAASRRL